jgi:uncharacterized Zn finger protein (UPF0148 family)
MLVCHACKGTGETEEKLDLQTHTWVKQTCPECGGFGKFEFRPITCGICGKTFDYTGPEARDKSHHCEIEAQREELREAAELIDEIYSAYWEDENSEGDMYDYDGRTDEWKKKAAEWLGRQK